MLLETIIIIIIILTIKNICELYNYNTNADLIEIYKDTNANIVENYQNKNLIIVNNVISKIDKLNNLSFDNININNPGYIIKDNDKYISFQSIVNNNINIFNNQNIVNDLKLINTFKDIYNKISQSDSCNFQSYISLFNGGYNLSPLKHCKNNWTCIGQIEGSTDIYLINPKHKNSNYFKEKSYKKISIKTTLEKGKMILIPSEWFYFYENKNKNISFTITFDNYYTYLFNLMR